MTTNNRTEKPFTFRFIDEGSKIHLELMNTTDYELKSVEVLTVFLSDEETPGGPSQARIRFEEIAAIKPKERIVLTHRTWINGKPAGPDQDQLERLKLVAGEASPYVLDISWKDLEGKSRFQRIPVGH